MRNLVSIEPNGPSNGKEKLRNLDCCMGENKDGRVKERELNTMGVQRVLKPKIPDQG